MKPTWHRASKVIFDTKGDARPGTMSVFADYDLGNWTFGILFEHDDCWYDLNFVFGPLTLSIIYWRVFMAVDET